MILTSARGLQFPQDLPLSPDVKRINPNGVAALAKDVRYLSEFVDTLETPILGQNLEELQQTVALMQTDNPQEFYDVSIRNKKYGRVNDRSGPLLLEKCVYRVLRMDSVSCLPKVGSHTQYRAQLSPRNLQPSRHACASTIPESCLSLMSQASWQVSLLHGT